MCFTWQKIKTSCWNVAFSVSILDFPNLASRSLSVWTALINTSSILEIILGARDIGAHNLISFKLKKKEEIHFNALFTFFSRILNCLVVIWLFMINGKLYGLFFCILILKHFWKHVMSPLLIFSIRLRRSIFFSAIYEILRQKESIQKYGFWQF